MRQGHELGCHTHDHCHGWDTPTAEFERSMVRNQKAAAEFLPSCRMRCLSYPVSGPRPATKRVVAHYYAFARSGGQTYNRGLCDALMLRAFFIERSDAGFAGMQRVIEENAGQRGWLIFATHDVSTNPTRFGCTPELFEKLVCEAVRSGARLLNMCAAFALSTGKENTAPAMSGA